MTPPNPPSRFVLRDLPFAARLTLAVTLCSVGVGYLSALVNLHFQEASPGEPLPTGEDVIVAYSGKDGVSQLERLLTANPVKPFNGQGSMVSALQKRRVGGWDSAVKRKAADLKLDPAVKAAHDQIEQAVQKDLDGERAALVAWIRAGFNKDAYEDDAFPLKGQLKDAPITARFVDGEGDQRVAKVKSILETRCVRCHSESASGPGSQYPLETYEQVAVYSKPDAATGKSLQKLALSTHVHLLGFSLLYGLTGLVFALTSYPAFLRVLIAPAALLAQVVDVSFWWLARLDAPLGPQFASAIRVSGGVVAICLVLQIVLSLYHLFGKFGKFVLTVVILAALAGGGLVAQKGYLQDYLAAEKSVGDVTGK